MSDLISRQAAIDALGGNKPVGDPSKMDDDDVVKMWERIRIINIINKLPSAQPERKTGRWILVSERFPEEGEEVLVYLFDGKSPYLAWIQDGLWRTEEFVIDVDEEPVAWMPLPQPYQGERREE